MYTGTEVFGPVYYFNLPYLEVETLVGLHSVTIKPLIALLSVYVLGSVRSVDSVLCEPSLLLPVVLPATAKPV